MIRGLTEGEAALAGEMFGEALRLETIRMVAAPWPVFRAFVAGRWFGRDWVVWPRSEARADFAAETVRRQSVFIHELTHVWQSQAGIGLARAKLKAGFSDAAYRYPDAPCHWDALNIEQQAMVVQHRFLASRGVNVPMAHAHFDRLCPLAKRMEI
ncbi:MAG: hypothetical protein V4707_04720 [Pseudomonadota bacterium]